MYQETANLLSKMPEIITERDKAILDAHMDLIIYKREKLPVINTSTVFLAVQLLVDAAVPKRPQDEQIVFQMVEQLPTYIDKLRSLGNLSESFVLFREYLKNLVNSVDMYNIKNKRLLTEIVATVLIKYYERYYPDELLEYLL